jgi:hypothetical protein
MKKILRAGGKLRKEERKRRRRRKVRVATTPTAFDAFFFKPTEPTTDFFYHFRVPPHTTTPKKIAFEFLAGSALHCCSPHAPLLVVVASWLLQRLAPALPPRCSSSSVVGAAAEC